MDWRKDLRDKMAAPGKQRVQRLDRCRENTDGPTKAAEGNAISENW